MKLIRKSIDTDGSGSVTVLMEEPEDLWHIYNIVSLNDHLTSTTTRKVARVSATGSVVNTKMHLKLTIGVEQIEWDGDACKLRIKGPTKEENEFVRLGQYHTIELSNDQTFTIYKKKWDFIHFERLDLACDPAKSAHVAAVVLHEGLANICFITSHMTIVRARIEMHIPKKRPNAPSGHDKATVRFYYSVVEAVHKHIDLSIIKCVIIAGPAFTTELFQKYLVEAAMKHDWKDILSNKSKFVCVHASSGHKYVELQSLTPHTSHACFSHLLAYYDTLSTAFNCQLTHSYSRYLPHLLSFDLTVHSFSTRHSLIQALRDPKVATLVQDVTAMEETKALENFFELLNSNPDQAYYGMLNASNYSPVG